MSLLAHLKGKGPNGFGYGSTAEEVTNGIDLHGQTMLVTGCNSGLGRETVRVLALRGARVIGTGRTVEKAREGLAGLGDKQYLALACELSEPASVRACIDAVTRDGARLDALICNAGIMALPELRQAHGIELQFFTNHIGHFILVNGLLERLAPQGRVVIVASNAHRRAPAAGIEFDNLSGRAATSPGRRTVSRSWPTSCSPRSWRAASPAAGPRTRCTRASSRPTSRDRCPRSRASPSVPPRRWC